MFHIFPHNSSSSNSFIVIFALFLFQFTFAIKGSAAEYTNSFNPFNYQVTDNFNHNHPILTKILSQTHLLFKNWKSLFITLIALGIPTTLFVLKPSILKNLLSSMFNSNGSSSFMNRRRFRYNSDRDPTYQKVMRKGGNIGGLVNDGNTCFMNSVLQSLASSNSLLEFLQNETITNSDNKKELAFTKSFKELLNKLNIKHFSKNHDYKTNPMLKTMTKSPNKNFLMGYNQEDAQEFFQSLLSELESDFKLIHPKISDEEKSGSVFYTSQLPPDSIHGIDQLGHIGPVYIPSSQIDPNLQDATEKSTRYNLITPVDGLSAERIGCLQCGEMGGIRYSVISGLSLNLPPDNYNALRLTDLLAKWIEPEIIEGVDCNRCALKSILEYQKSQLDSIQAKETPSAKLIELLKIRIGEVETELQKPIIDDETFKKLHTKNMMKKCSKAKQILISRPPPLLAIHINRSVFDPMTYRVRKNNARVVFPLKLDLEPFVAEPNDINTDARLPLSKKAKVQETVEEQREKEIEAEESAGSSVETPDGSEDQDEEEQEQEQETVKTATKELRSDEDDSDYDSEEEEDNEPSYRPQEQKIPTMLEKQDISGPLVYALRSVIVHYGTHNYGHYIAFRKFRGVWWRTSDETIDIVDEDEVLSAPGVFMLFYELDTLSKDEDDDESLENGVGEVKIAGETDEEEEEKEDDDEGEEGSMGSEEEGEGEEESKSGEYQANTLANL